MKYDPKRWEDMTNEEKKLLSRQLREEMKDLPYDPDDDSLEILAKIFSEPESS